MVCSVQFNELTVIINKEVFRGYRSNTLKIQIKLTWQCTKMHNEGNSLMEKTDRVGKINNNGPQGNHSRNQR